MLMRNVSRKTLVLLVSSLFCLFVLRMQYTKKNVIHQLPANDDSNTDNGNTDENNKDDMIPEQILKLLDNHQELFDEKHRKYLQDMLKSVQEKPLDEKKSLVEENEEMGETIEDSDDDDVDNDVFLETNGNDVTRMKKDSNKKNNVVWIEPDQLEANKNNKIRNENNYNAEKNNNFNDNRYVEIHNLDQINEGDLFRNGVVNMNKNIFNEWLHESAKIKQRTLISPSLSNEIDGMKNKNRENIVQTQTHVINRKTGETHNEEFHENSPVKTEDVELSKKDFNNESFKKEKKMNKEYISRKNSDLEKARKGGVIDGKKKKLGNNAAQDNAVNRNYVTSTAEGGDKRTDLAVNKKIKKKKSTKKNSKRFKKGKNKEKLRKKNVSKSSSEKLEKDHSKVEQKRVSSHGIEYNEEISSEQKEILEKLRPYIESNKDNVKNVIGSSSKYLKDSNGQYLEKFSVDYNFRKFGDLNNYCDYRDGKILCPDVRQHGETVFRQCNLAITRMLKVFDAICAKHGIGYWLMSGTLLGAIRQQNSIPWDYDADIGITFDDYGKLIRIIRTELPESIFFQDGSDEPDFARIKPTSAKLRDVNSCYGSTIRDGGDFHDGLQVDIYTFKKKFTTNFFTGNEQVVIVDKFSGGGTFNFEDIFPLERVFYDGVKLNVPRDAKKVLALQFGEDFMTPPKKSEQKPRVGAGGYIPIPWLSCDKIERLPEKDRRDLLLDSILPQTSAA